MKGRHYKLAEYIDRLMKEKKIKGDRISLTSAFLDDLKVIEDEVKNHTENK